MERTMRSSSGWITRVTVQQEQYDCGPFTLEGSLDDVIASLAAYREEIPEGSRAGARCDFDVSRGYEDSACARIEVEYDRPATDDEIRMAEATEQRRRAEILARKRADFQRLKTELGE